MWHVTRDTWQVTRDTGRVWGGEHPFKVSAPLLTVCDLWYYKDLEEKDESLNQWMTRLLIEQPWLHRVCSIH